MLEWSLWISEHIGWPVVGWIGVVVVLATAAAWIAYEASVERERRRRRRAWAARDREGAR